jgi:hypothetical protein
MSIVALQPTAGYPFVKLDKMQQTYTDQLNLMAHALPDIYCWFSNCTICMCSGFSYLPVHLTLPP